MVSVALHHRLGLSEPVIVPPLKSTDWGVTFSTDRESARATTAHRSLVTSFNLLRRACVELFTKIRTSNRDDRFLVQFMSYTMTETSPPPTSRRFAPTPVETTVKKVRRFAVEPVETTTRSSKKEEAQIENESAIEKDFAPAKRRFVPQPVETTFKSNRQAANPLPTPEPTPVSIHIESPPEDTPKPRRRFIPELIETSKRSKKAGDARPATLPTDKVRNTSLHVLKYTYHRTPNRLTSLLECQIYTHDKNERFALPSFPSLPTTHPTPALLLSTLYPRYLLEDSPPCGPTRTQEEVQDKTPSNPNWKIYPQTPIQMRTFQTTRMARHHLQDHMDLPKIP